MNQGENKFGWNSNQIFGILGTAVACGVLWLILPVIRPLVASIAIFGLLGWGWSRGKVLWGEAVYTLETTGLSVAAGLATWLVSILLISYTGITFSPVILGLLLLAIAVLPLLARLPQSDEYPYQYPIIDWWWFSIPLTVALTVRLPWFGYREIQGDEGIVLVRAADALLGDTVEMLLHRKGPMEILLSMGVWGLAGEIDDLWIRLPFLLCNLLSLLLFYGLLHRWFGRNVAVIGTCLLAIMGFHVAFSRVVQYQSLVMMWGIGASFAADRYRLSGRAWELVLSAILLAAGLLSHYDAVLFAPAILLLCLNRWWSEEAIPVKTIGGATAVGFFMLAAFYIPFAFGPDFQNAIGYLLDERVGTESGGSLADVWQMVTFYNSSWYIVGLIGFALVGGFAIRHRTRPDLSRWGIVAFGLVPLLFYTAVVSVPRTHVYTFFPGLILFAALGIEWIAQKRVSVPWLYWAGWVGLSGWFLVCASYIWLLFTWGPAEIQRNWGEKRPNQILYWTTWESPPEFGLFGFPYQAGWRHLRHTELAGTVYASNEEAEITNWYMAQAQRTHCNTADLFLLAQNVQDEVAWNPSLQANKVEFIAGPQLQAFAADELMFGTGRVTPGMIAKPKFGGRERLDVALGEQVDLLGYDLIERPDGVEVVLYWRANSYFNENYQAFVHAIDETGKLVTQYDSAPECGINPTTRWEPGTVIRDPHPLVFPADWPADRPLRLVAGMYNLITLERLPVAGEPGAFVALTEVTP